ncbi:MAG: hypothetical protein AMJ46_09420 [Latescibacteria bacterium DG_63]|nr:MAG: hypothetical protein AMJ46_09420 [Latescibacteria bacterium DG_63]
MLRERRRPFAKRSRTGLGRVRSFGRLKIASQRNERAVRVSKTVSLTVTLLLMGMLVYALVKFLEMVRLRGLDVWPLIFVPAAIIIVLLVLLRVARSLLREIRERSSSE